MSTTTVLGSLQTGTGRADSTHVAHATTPDDAPRQDLHDWLFGVPAAAVPADDATAADAPEGSEAALADAQTDADSQPEDLDAGRPEGDHEVGGLFPTSGGVMGAVAQDAGVWLRRGTRTRPAGLRRAGLRGTAALVGVGALLVASPAAGYWLASTTTTGTVTAETLSAPSSLTAAATATTLTISVSAPNGGPTPTGYTVTPTGSTARDCTLTGSTSGPVATCVVTGLASGTSYTLAVRSTLGSWVSSTSTSLTTSTAAAPAPAAPALTAASDTGVSSTDGITNDTTPTLTGAKATGLGGAQITVLDGSVGVATTTAAADGSWTVTLANPLSEGSHLVTAVASLNGGDRGTASAATTVRVDTTAPTGATAASGTCGNGAATGDTSGWYCRNATFSSSSGLRLVFTASDAVGVGSFSYRATTSTSSMPSTTPTPNTSVDAGASTPRILSQAGYARVGVLAVDLAGNVSTTGTVLATVDTTAPGTGTASTSGVGSTTNGYCRGSVRVTVSGISDSGVTSGLTTADWSVTGGTSGSAAITSGSTTFQVTGPDGTPRYTVTTRDAAGNTATSAVLTSGVALDNSAPTATTVALSNGNGTVAKSDTITLTFADATSGVNPASVYSGWSTGSTSTLTGSNVTARITDNGSNDTLSFSASNGTLSLGTVALGANYVGSGNTLAFGGSGSNATTVAWSSGVVTVTLGTASGSPQTVSGTPGITWSPPTTVTDLAGNTLATATVTGTGRF